MDFTGILKVKMFTEQVSEQFKKRDFVVTDESSQYPQHITFQLTQDKCGLIDQFAPGSEIKVHFNLRGREWKNAQGETKYFNTLQAWRIEGQKNLQVDTGSKKTEPVDNGVYGNGETKDDDLPF